MVPPLVNLVRFGPSVLRLHALEVLMALGGFPDGLNALSRSGLAAEAVALVQATGDPGLTCNSADARAEASLRVLAARMLALLGSDAMMRSKVAALG